MTAWRSADIDKIKRFAGQQLVDGLVPLSARASLQKGPALAPQPASVAATI
jgi:hypothetical protein